MEPINQNYNEDDVKAAIAKALENFYGSLIAKIDAINIKDIMKKQGENFAEAQRTLRTSGGRTGFEAIVGYAYGTKTESGRGKAKIYEEVAGEEFWETITGDKNFYTKIISFMDTLPEKYIDDYKESYARASNRLVRDFSVEFCNPDGTINWEKLVDYNSGSPRRKARKRSIK